LSHPILKRKLCLFARPFIPWIRIRRRQYHKHICPTKAELAANKSTVLASRLRGSLGAAQESGVRARRQGLRCLRGIKARIVLDWRHIQFCQAANKTSFDLRPQSRQRLLLVVIGGLSSKPRHPTCLACPCPALASPHLVFAL
jgi:hypothetical protein